MAKKIIRGGNPFKGLNMRFVVHPEGFRWREFYNGPNLGRALQVQSKIPGSRLQGFEGGYTNRGIPGGGGAYGVTKRTPKG